MEVDPALALEIATLARQRTLNEITAKNNSLIQKFYAGKNVFITGGTGFIGKQLIEKLLRACPDINKIYILARPKKEKTVQQRAAELTDEQVYNSVKKLYPDFAKKIVVVAGNITELQLGLSEKDVQLVTDEVNIFFHVAATTRFDESLKSAVLTNVRATREIVLLASKCKNLCSILHVSTAFSHCPLPEVKEKFYPSPMPFEVIIDLVENTDDERLNMITETLIKPWPNTYTFTKAIAEDVIRKMADKLPAAIVRPAIVAATYMEPAPGWLDISSIFGPSAVIAGSGTGVMRCFLADKSCKVDLVPADFVNNACIAAAYRAAIDFESGNSESKIYTCSSTKRNSVTWGSISDICNGYCRWMISPRAVWYCFNVIQSNRFIHMFLTFLWHTIPAFLVDTMLTLIGNKPRYRKLYNKMYKLNELLSYFCLKEWAFDDTNIQQLHKNLTEDDKQIFQFDIESLDWKEYIQIWYLGIRRYIIKDDLKNTKVGTKRQHYFKVGHYIIIGLYISIFWSMIRTIFFVVFWLFS